MSDNLAIISLAFLSGLTTIVGVVLAIILKRRLGLLIIGIGFSTGIMLLISFFELITESMSAIGLYATFLAVSLGIVVLAVLNFIIPHTHFFKEKGVLKNQLVKSAYLVAFGLILHDFPEGFAMANSYIFSPNLGIFVAIGITLHNIPEEFAIATPLVAASQKKAPLFKAAVISGFAEPAGALLGLFAVSVFSYLNSFFMSFAAGAMIFISLHELLPLARHYNKPNLFTLGVILSIFVFMGLKLIIPE